MSYRPKRKTDNSGTLVDLPLDAATINGFTVATSVPANAKFTDTTYESKAEDQGGTAVSLVTTGEKYIWNHQVPQQITYGNYTSEINSTYSEREMIVNCDTDRGIESSSIVTSESNAIIQHSLGSKYFRINVGLEGRIAVEGYRPNSSITGTGGFDISFDLLTLAPFADKTVTTTIDNSSTNTQIPTAAAVWNTIPKTTERWTFTLDDDSTVVREIYIK